ncbi:hypothetical protein VNO78_18247 [Psophocarpus tetragonolobus]|uniref:X8 domain-containing protein n=1 Tax=Psophocarpus tetragonolobus TaxID=3891 RepID=A0AAN9XLN6_PSOTE
MMAKEASLCLLFLSSLVICSSGTGTASVASTFLQNTKISNSQIPFSATDSIIFSTLDNTNLSLHLFLTETLVHTFVSSKSSVVSWLETHLINILPQVDVRSIIVRCGSEPLGQDHLYFLLPILRSIHSFLSKLQSSREIKVSVAFPLSFIHNLKASYENHLLRIVMFIQKIDSFIMVQDSIDGDGELSFVQSVIERATLAASILPCKHVPLVLTFKSRGISSSVELPLFSDAISKYLEAGSQFTRRIVALYAEVHTTEGVVVVLKNLKREEGQEILPLPLKENQSKVHIRRTLQDTTTVSPTNPTPPSPVISPPDTPTIITVPSTNPVTVSPTNPASTPVTVPSTTPVTNPVTSYPPPSGIVPVTNALPPPPNTNAQAMPGAQSWCVAKTGVPEASLQSALDYACGMPNVDCSQIQQGGSCYNPNSLQNHASFAFNTYYQKNPAPTSCDFGGTATIVNTNPSSGSCIFSSSSGAGTSGSSGPVLGSQSPPDLNTSYSAGLRPFLGCMVLAISLVTVRLTT